MPGNFEAANAASPLTASLRGREQERDSAMKREASRRVSLLFCFLVVGSELGMAAEQSAEVPPNMRPMLRELFDGFALGEIEALDLADHPKAKLLRLVYVALEHTLEVRVHRMNGALDNQVFVHESGAEAVYDGNGRLVTDCVNRGSFNYFLPAEHPLLHFAGDMLPWIMLGNCREDPTTPGERLDASVLDSPTVWARR
jgi:hypothetical protein